MFEILNLETENCLEFGFCLFVIYVLNTYRSSKKSFAIEQLLAEKYHLIDASLAAQDIKQIIKGKPPDYVIGWTPFLGCRIDLSERPFIPRPETEYWVGEAIKSFQSRFGGRPFRCLDIFSGSGSIGIAILKHMPASQMTFVEKNSRFVEQVKINLRKNNISKNHFRVIQSDLFKSVTEKFNVILANPPYAGSKTKIDEAVKKYEPAVAWDGGGADGLMVIQKFLKSAKDFINSDGEIWMEFGTDQKLAIASLLRRFGYSQFSFYRDQYRRMRYAVIREGGFMRHR